MIKVKDGYAKLVGTTASGSASHILLSNGGVKAVSDFALKSELPDVSKYLPLTGGTLILENGDSFKIKRNKSNSYGSYIAYETNDGMLGRLGMYKENVEVYFGSLTDKSYNILHEGNFNSYAPKLDGTGASGTWSIDISGNAKSSTLSLYLLTGVGSEYDANTLAFSDHLLRWYSSIPSTSSNLPTVTGWLNGLLALPLHSNGVTAQLYFSATKALFYRSMASDDWHQIAFTDLIPTVTNYYWANVKVSNTSSTTTTPIFGGLTVNGHAIINKRLTIGLDLGVWDNGRAELELISPSGQANDLWLGSGLRDWSITSRPAAENNTLNFHAHTSSTTTPLVMVLEKSGNTTIYGNLQIGKSDTRNYIAFRGTTGDNPGSFNHTYIGENLWGGSESSELVLYKGNDIGATATTVDVSGADRIRHIAGGHLFQIYKSALSGTFETICTSTVPVNMLAIHLNSIQTYAPLVIVGEKYSGNYGINMQNSDIVGINALYTSDNAEDGGEGLQFSRGNGYYDSIWASAGVLYFSPNGNLNRSGSYSNNYTVLHTGNYTGTLDGRYVNVTGDTMTGNLIIGNTTIYATGTNGGTNSLAVADDCILGDCNVGGVLGLKATNATTAGIKFFNSSSTSLGLLTAVDVDTLKWDSKVLLHSNNWPSYIGGDGYVMRTWTIDATGLDLNTWYPVTMTLPTLHWVRIEVKETLHARSKPSWSTHNSGFHVTKIWHSLGYGWGTTQAVNQRFVLQSDYCWCNTDPVRGIGLLSNSGTEYVYVRGGGKYYVSTSHNIVPTLRTSTYTISSQSIGPTTSTPAGITAMYSDKSIHAPHFYESSDATLKTNIETINTSDNIPQLKSFTWKEDGKHSYGLIAQELEEMGYTELVEESNGKKTVQYSAALSLIVGKLLVKIQEIEKENKELRDEINNLKTNKLWQS